MRGAAPIAILALALVSTPARADEVAPEPEPAPKKRAARVLEQAPEFGTYYDDCEPTFYTGFAPRPVDPRRVHLHVGRGNQLRITVVLSDETLRGYARDLQARRDTYRALVDGGRIVAATLCGTDGRRGYLHHLAVAESHRRGGLGRRLADRCLDALRGAGITRCHIHVFARNAQAREFWRASGWRLREDLVVMSIDRA